MRRIRNGLEPVSITVRRLLRTKAAFLVIDWRWLYFFLRKRGLANVEQLSDSLARGTGLAGRRCVHKM